MILTFRPIKVWPKGWQERRYDSRPYSPFRASYRQTVELLDFELNQVGATGATLQVDASEDDCRLDGQLRANAKVGHPGVILTVETKNLGSLVYATDRYQSWRSDDADWKANLRAIALGMAALRTVERYGIAEQGQQYAGYREIGSGIPLGEHVVEETMTADEAARLLADGIWSGPLDVDTIVPLVETLYRQQAKRFHPDAPDGGDPAKFRRLTMARNLLANL